MISEGYEKAIFKSPVSDRYAIAHPDNGGPASEPVRVINHEFDFLRDLRIAAQIVKKMVDSDETLFRAVERRHPRALLAIQPTSLGAQFMRLYKVTQEEMELYFPNHGFNPYAELLFKTRKDMPSDVEFGDYWNRAREDDAVQVAARLNEFVNQLRKKAGEREFKKTLDRFRRCCDKNTRSLRLYIDAIFQHRGSRHLVIRLDLGYAMQDAWTAARPTSVTLQQAKEDLAKFQRYLREKWPGTGFAAKLEYGLLRGYHFHVLIFLNGHLRQNDVLIANILGEHWKDVICEGKGRYWNCNAQEYQQRGIGMINYHDGDKRVALIEKVAAYLTKTDFWMRFQPGGKTLFKGLMPERPPKGGRPRERAFD